MSRERLIVAVESSCDESAVALVREGGEVLSERVASQSDLHASTGGVIPEVAAREHHRWVPKLISEVMDEAATLSVANEIDAVAVTTGPGLIGSLLVGAGVASAWAWGRGAWALGRVVFGRNPLFFPNALTPSWVKEGLAVHYESKFTGSGRSVSTGFPMIARTAVRDAFVPSPQRWSLSTSQFPGGQTAYAWGTLLMNRSAMQRDGGMRRFVDITAANVVPFLLSRNSRQAFGASFDSLFARMTDSLRLVSIALPGDSVWHAVSANGWYAASPRWVGVDSIVWSASNGREVTGLYIAPADRANVDAPRRLAWRNTLDVNAPVPGDTSGAMVFAQSERLDPYVVRSDLYRSRRGDRGGDRGGETRLTKGARLSQPDVRADGSIVAVQLGADRSRLVRVSATGDSIVPITPDVLSERWAEPRWSPDGQRIAAVQLLATGEQRVVVMDVSGELQLAVAGARGVFSSPSFTPDGKRLYYVSDEPTGLGGTDIYYIEKNNDGSWKATNNLGQVVNTEGNELFPTFYDGLFCFSSNSLFSFVFKFLFCEIF